MHAGCALDAFEAVWVIPPGHPDEDTARSLATKLERAREIDRERL